MNLTGGRPVLVLNLCALIPAAVVTGAGAYILFKTYGRVGWDDYLLLIFPLFVMLIIRNKTFSTIYLFLYLAFAMSLGFKALGVFWGGFLDPKMPVLAAVFFDLISFVCICVYVVTHVRSVASDAFALFDSRGMK